MATPGPATEYNTSDFLEMFETNVVTSVNAIQAFIIVAQQNAMIINVSAGLARIQPMPGMSAYASSKAAQLKAVEYLAVENPSFHFVNFHPGLVVTEIQGTLSQATAQDEVELSAHFCIGLASPKANFLKNRFVGAHWDVNELLARSNEIKEARLLTVGLNRVAM